MVKKVGSICVLCMSFMMVWAQYDKIGIDYGNGLRRVEKSKQTDLGWETYYGFINSEGKEIIPVKYRLLDEFSEGKKLIFAQEKSGDKTYLIDKMGKIAIPYEVGEHMTRDGFTIIKDGYQKYGLVDNKNGKIVVPPIYSWIEHPSAGRIHVRGQKKEDFKHGYLDAETYKLVIPIVYDDAASFHGELAGVEKKGKLGAIDKNGNTVIPFQYDGAAYFIDFEYGLSAVKKNIAGNERYAIIDKSGKELTLFEFSWISRGSPWGYDAEYANSNNRCYFDFYGKRYTTEEERNNAQLSILISKAEEGEERFYGFLGNLLSDKDWCKERLGWEKKDDSKAFYWLLKAAQSGYSDSWSRLSTTYFKLAEYYEEGKVTAPNISEAKKWYKMCSQTSGGWESEFARKHLLDLGEDIDIDPKPNPSPSNNYATITWLAFSDRTMQKEYQLKIGISSDSKIEDVTISVNGTQDRGIKTVNSSDNDMTINRTLTLNEGTNIIKVSVRNAAGTIQEEKTIVYRPQGGKLPTIEWLDFVATANKKEYQMKLGIKSKTKVEEVNVTVNGALTRGIKPVPTDGYDLKVDRTLALSEGVNRIVVSVRNGDGISTSEKVITYQGVNPTPIFNDKRIAFVVGNSHYSNSEMNLANPENDAKDVAEKLKGLGFEVILKLDATLETMDKELSSFKEKAKDYDVAMFYYAGHGIQNKGVNYIIPTNIENLAEDNLKYKCVNMERVLDVMEDSQCKLKIVILDACRNDPVSRKWHRSAGTRGLSIMNAPIGTIISFSTSPGSTALDGTGRNSPYTQAFLNTLDMPNLDVFHFFQKVGASVLDMTQKAQNPWLSVSFTGDFYFNKQ